MKAIEAPLREVVFMGGMDGMDGMGGMEDMNVMHPSMQLMHLSNQPLLS